MTSYIVWQLFYFCYTQSFKIHQPPQITQPYQPPDVCTIGSGDRDGNEDNDSDGLENNDESGDENGEDVSDRDGDNDESGDGNSEDVTDRDKDNEENGNGNGEDVNDEDGGNDEIGDGNGEDVSDGADEDGNDLDSYTNSGTVRLIYSTAAIAFLALITMLF